MFLLHGATTTGRMKTLLRPRSISRIVVCVSLLSRMLGLLKFLPDRQGDSGDYDHGLAVAIADDESIVLAGTTHGSWGSNNAGTSDFAAVKLNSTGQEVWRWQASPSCGGRHSWSRVNKLERTSLRRTCICQARQKRHGFCARQDAPFPHLMPCPSLISDTLHHDGNDCSPITST